MIHTLLNNLAMKKKERKFGQTMVEYSNLNKLDFQMIMPKGAWYVVQGLTPKQLKRIKWFFAILGRLLQMQ
jgi:hypothetical protein